MYTRTRDKILKNIADKTNQPLFVVEHAVSSVFSFVTKTIQEGKFENVLIYKFGKFAVKPGRLLYNRFTEDRVNPIIVPENSMNEDAKIDAKQVNSKLLSKDNNTFDNNG